VLKYIWPEFEILTTYISRHTVYLVENLTINFTQKLLLHFYGFSVGYIWGKKNFEKTYVVLLCFYADLSVKKWI